MDTQEARIYIAIIITVIVLGIIIGYFAVSVIRQQRRNLELQKANALAEIAAREKERARNAADLHDELGPLLSVVRFQLDHVELVNRDEKEQLTNASKHLDGLIERMRDVANNLMPSALVRKGLIGAVEEFASNAEATSTMKISVTGDKDFNVEEGKSINIYRVIQELVHNCLKHAQATKMEIEMEMNNGFLKILCRDNGKGFDPIHVSKTSEGIGLRSIRNRIDIMDGSLVIETQPGNGTAFLFEIPI